MHFLEDGLLAFKRGGQSVRYIPLSPDMEFTDQDFSKRGRLLTNKLILQGYNESRLKSSFRKFYGRYNDLVCGYNLSLAHMLNDLFHTIC